MHLKFKAGDRIYKTYTAGFRQQNLLVISLVNHVTKHLMFGLMQDINRGLLG